MALATTPIVDSIDLTVESVDDRVGVDPYFEEDIDLFPVSCHNDSELGRTCGGTFSSTCQSCFGKCFTFATPGTEKSE